VIDPLIRGLGPHPPALRAAGEAPPVVHGASAPARRLALFGVPVSVDVTWLLGLGLATWTFAHAVLPLQVPGRRPAAYVAAGALAAFLLLGSLVVHAAGHWLAARRAGVPVMGLTLSLLGGALMLAVGPRSPGAEARIALGGPLASLMVAVLAALTHVAMVEAGTDPLLSTLPALVAAGNLAVALVNLLPGLPLDGGRVLRALAWKAAGDPAAATRLARRAGRGIAATLLVVAVVASVSGDAAAAVWAAALGLAMHLHH
jgi:Zn-dependent protease